MVRLAILSLRLPIAPREGRRRYSRSREPRQISAWWWIQAAIQLLGQLGLNPVNLWQFAEVLDVQCETCTPVVVDGTLYIESNPNMVIAPGDTIEEPHYMTQRALGVSLNNNPLNMNIPETGMQISMGAAQGGGNSTTANSMLSLNGGFPPTNYQGQGGFMIPSNGINMQVRISIT
jgi:hypothetical protein